MIDVEWCHSTLPGQMNLLDLTMAKSSQVTGPGHGTDTTGYLD